MNPPSLSRARALRSVDFRVNIGGVLIEPGAVVVRDPSLVHGCLKHGKRVHASDEEFLRLGHDYPADFEILE